MRLLLILSLGLACSACAGDGASPQGGVANYDALARARSDCLSKGGDYVLNKDGNPDRIDSFECKRK
jgi:hypothetical protein